MTKKIVIVVNSELPNGVAANIVGLLGISIGHHIKEIVGPHVKDATGRIHPGMSTMALPILGAAPEKLLTLHNASTACEDLAVFDVTDAAISARDYNVYTATLQNPDKCWMPQGLALYGPREKVDQFTKRLKLLR